MTRDSEIYLPTLWDERLIGSALEKYKENPPVLSRYVDGIISRFVVGQEQRTMETRTRYLESFNKYAAIARESYKWHRYMKGGRAKLEEDAEDTKAELEKVDRKYLNAEMAKMRQDQRKKDRGREKFDEY